MSTICRAGQQQVVCPWRGLQKWLGVLQGGWSSGGSECTLHYLPAITFSLPDFCSAFMQMLLLRSLYLEDKLRKDISLPDVAKLRSVFGLRFQISCKYLNFS